MQTGTDRSLVIQPNTTSESCLITVGDIAGAYTVVLGKLRSIFEKSHEFANACIYAGKLLSRKREELKGTEVSFDSWIKDHRAETGISRPTAYRLIDVFDLREELTVSRVRQLEEVQIASVWQLRWFLKAAQEGDEKKVEEAAQKKTATPAPSKVGQMFTRMFKLFKDPKKVEPEEKNAFVENTADSVRLCHENGWKIPGLVIDVETEDVTD
jgi:hypothetical protein